MRIRKKRGVGEEKEDKEKEKNEWRMRAVY